MSNTVTNILTINGTDKQVAKVREFIKGSNNESISFQSIFPMPKKLKGKHMVEQKDLPYPPGMKPISIPDWMDWRLKFWGCKWDAETIHDEAVDAPNRILFNTPNSTSFEAIVILSLLFPEVTFNLIFSDEYPKQYCGEFTITGGEISNYACYNGFSHTDIGGISVDQQMEYYFRTHEYDRENWKKDADGEWINISDEEEGYEDE